VGQPTGTHHWYATLDLSARRTLPPPPRSTFEKESGATEAPRWRTSAIVRSKVAFLHFSFQVPDAETVRQTQRPVDPIELVGFRTVPPRAGLHTRTGGCFATASSTALAPPVFGG
jgi:hypothetical protein